MYKICNVCGRTSLECQVTHCSSYGKDLCSKHKNQWHRHGRFTDDDKNKICCEVCGIMYASSNKVHWCGAAGMYLCGKHRNQFVRLGHFLDRTKREGNIFEIVDDHVEIVFFNHEGDEAGRSLIDVDDLDKCKAHRWYMTEQCGNTRYVKSVINGVNTSLHRYISNAESGTVIDHIDRNGLNNRKCNLRSVTPSENSVNSKTRSRTGHKNIYHKGNKYQVQIIRNYKMVLCKTYSTLESAIKARDMFIKNYNSIHNRQV